VIDSLARLNFYKYLVLNADYPDEEKKRGISGKPYISFFLNCDGSIDSVHTILSSGNSMLDYSAIKLIEQTPKKYFESMALANDTIKLTVPISYRVVGGDFHDPLLELMNKGVKEMNGGSLELAIQKFNSVLEIDHKNLVALFNRGVANFKYGSYFEACVDWNKAEELGDMDSKNFQLKYCNDSIILPFYLTQADILMRADNFVEAKKIYNTVIDINTFDTIALVNRAICNSKLNLVEFACQDLNQAIIGGSALAKALQENICSDEALILGFVKELRISFKNKDMERANFFLSKLIELKPDDPNLYYQRAEINLKLKRNDLACEDAKKALEYGFNASMISLQKFCDK
jgi:TonB family protein